MGAAAGVMVLIVLAAVAIAPRFGYQVLVVRSGSMRPSIPVGSLAVYQPVDANRLADGDVIVFRHPGTNDELVTHRIVRIENGPAGRRLVTKGDANGAPDSWRIPAAGQGSRYAFSIPVAGYVLATLGSPLVRLGALGVTVVGAAVVGLGAIWRPRKRLAPA
jgi:signal peptidase